MRATHNATQPLTPTLSHYWERGTTSIQYLAIVVLCGVLGGTLWLMYPRPCANFRQATLQTPTQPISVAIADSAEKQSRGLEGCRYIPKNSGMYFPFQPAQNTIFWMKNMLIPIDIIWIKDSQVVGIEKNVPNEPLNTPNADLKTYLSPGEIDGVLEIEAGKAEEYGIAQGSQLNLTQGK